MAWEREGERTSVAVGCGASPSMEVLAREAMSALVKPAFRSGAKNSRISSCERSFQESIFAIRCKSPRKDFSATPIGGVELKEPMNQPCLPRANDANHYCNCVPLSKTS